MTEQTFTTPVPGHEYEIFRDGAEWHEGRMLTGILVALDGRAYAGRIERDGQDEFVSIALTEDGSMRPAPDGWEYYVKRDLPGLLDIYRAEGEAA